MKTVTVFPNPKKKIDFSTLGELFSVLSINGCRIFMDSLYRETVGKSSGGSIEYFDDTALADILRKTDLMIVLGGDGSILEASRYTAECGIPILGINFGRVGYMAEIEIHELDIIEKIIKDEIKVKTEERIMLDVSIEREGSEIFRSPPVLNDAVLSNGPVSRLISFDLFCDGELTGSYRADGMIVATPTGSTAYSMSAGGPILDPCLDSLCVTPICPHSIMSRPVVFNGSSVIEFRNMMCRDNKKYLTVDGKDSIDICDGDIIKIKRSEYTTKLIRIKDGGFLHVLRRKMSE